MKNIKNKYIIIILAILFGIITLAVVMTFSPLMGISEASSVDVDDIRTANWDKGEYYDLTKDTKKMYNGEIIDIRKYGTEHFASNAEIYHYTTGSLHTGYRASGDDPITTFLPKSLFKTVNDENGPLLYVGNGYGFLIDSFKTGRKIAGSIVPGIHSTVMLFTIDSETNTFSTKSHLKYKVTQVFQSEFVYYTKAEAQTLTKLPALVHMGTRNICSNEYFYGGIDEIVITNIPNDGIVIPIPSGYSVESGVHDIRQLQRYYITEVDMGLSLLNENNANPKDKAYYTYEDDFGLIFSQTDVSYQGKHLLNGGTTIIDEPLEVMAAGMTFSLENLMFLADMYEGNPIFEKIFSTMGDMVAVLNVAKSAWDFMFAVAELSYELSPHFETISNKEFTYIPEHNSRELQLDYEQILHKEALLSMGKSTKGKIMLGVGDFFDMDFQVNVTNSYINARALSRIGISVNKLTGYYYDTLLPSLVVGETISAYGAYTKRIDIRHETLPEYTEIEVDSEERLFVLNNGEARAKFTAPATGGYIFSGPYGGREIELSLSKIMSNGELEFIKSYNPNNNRNIILANLDAGVEYCINTNLSDIDKYGSYVLRCESVDTANIGRSFLTYDDAASKFLEFTVLINKRYSFTIINGGATTFIYDADFYLIHTQANEGKLTVALTPATYYLEIRYPTSGTSEQRLDIAEETTVFFDSKGGSDVNAITVSSANPNANLPVPTRTGYKFLRWRVGTNNNYGSYITTTDQIRAISGTFVVLEADWEPIEYAIIYQTNGGSAIPEGKYTIEDTVVLSRNTTKHNYTFVGWYETSTFMFEEVTTLEAGHTGVKVFYAKWAFVYPSEIINVTLKLSDYDNAVFQNTTVTYGTAHKFDAVGYVGYNFLGWTYNGEVVTSPNGTFTANGGIWNILPTSPNGSIVLYPKRVVKNYSVTLNKDGGTGGSSAVTTTYNVAMPYGHTAPTRNGYTFAGYYTGTDGGGTQYYDSEMKSTNTWRIDRNSTLYAYWKVNYAITLNANGGSGGTTSVSVASGYAMPANKIAPSRTGYIFKGYYTSAGNGGTQYYDSEMKSVRNWDLEENYTLYAQWTAISYTVTLDKQSGSGGTSSVTAAYGSAMPSGYTAPTRTGYIFDGYYLGKDGTSTKYYASNMGSSSNWNIASSKTLYANWKPIKYSVQFAAKDTTGAALTNNITGFTATYDASYSKTAQMDGHTFVRWELKIMRSSTVISNNTNYSASATLSIKNLCSVDGYIATLTAVYEKDKCIAEGTLITLSDGRQVPVETLTGNERLLVWNLKTGKFDSAPILFVDSDPLMTYRVIKLTFSDGTEVKVISEHAFWDFTLNKYVYLREDAEQYIGHYFNKQITNYNGKLDWTRVQLVDVEVNDEVTTAWSPVTYSHLCYYVNGMLSMPGGIDGLINIFDVNSNSMKYNQSAMNQDIKEYGLFTYEEFAEILPVPEEIFNAFNGQYLKIAIGKGLIDLETLERLVLRYAEFF